MFGNGCGAPSDDWVLLLALLEVLFYSLQLLWLLLDPPANLPTPPPPPPLPPPPATPLPSLQPGVQTTPFPSSEEQRPADMSTEGKLADLSLVLSFFMSLS